MGKRTEGNFKWVSLLVELQMFPCLFTMMNTVQFYRTSSTGLKMFLVKEHDSGCFEKN